MGAVKGHGLRAQVLPTRPALKHRLPGHLRLKQEDPQLLLGVDGPHRFKRVAVDPPAERVLRGVRIGRPARPVRVGGVHMLRKPPKHLGTAWITEWS